MKVNFGFGYFLLLDWAFKARFVMVNMAPRITVCPTLSGWTRACRPSVRGCHSTSNVMALSRPGIGPGRPLITGATQLFWATSVELYTKALESSANLRVLYYLSKVSVSGQNIFKCVNIVVVVHPVYSVGVVKVLND